MTTPGAEPPSRELPWWAWDLLAMGVAASDLSLHLFRNWVSFVEGQLGLSAALVRQGRWPHLDYNDVYSGGLALLDAGAQRLFGDDLLALRIPLAVATILWVAVLAACLRRFVPPAAAAGLALVGYLWGPPLYTAAMPTWYLLFLATATLWCLLRWDESEDPRWWGAAGVCIGVALFFKINALFLLAGAGCVLLTDDRHRGGLVGGMVVLLGVLGALVTVGSGWWWPFAARLIVPLAIVAVVALRHSARTQKERPGGLRPMFVAGAWLALGVGAIVVPWFLTY
ncbi:MAG TPA: glycosyltransferase family 39 protein, partial [Gemmatimonadales bacterium]|nr:glycosyltransferase family 39 protein [Gemmatimonadales bacterium]